MIEHWKLAIDSRSFSPLVLPRRRREEASSPLVHIFVLEPHPAQVRLRLVSLPDGLFAFATFRSWTRDSAQLRICGEQLSV